MKSLPAWLMTALALAGCADDFVPFNRLTSLRVLAVQSEPVAPLTGETATLVPLVYTPAGDEVESYAWSWCPFPGGASEGYPCLVTEAEVRELAGAAADTIPPFDLGDGATAIFDNRIAPEVLELLCAGTAEAPALVSCEGGFPVQLKLTVRTAASQVVTIRTLRLRFDPGSEPNANPLVDELVAVLDGEEVALGPDPAVAVPRGIETTIRARVAEEAAETFTGLDDDGDPAEKREQLVLTWFVESGDTSDERTVFIEDAVPLAEATENEWEPAEREDYPEDESALVVVVRDNREGVSWRMAAAALEEAP